MKKILFIYCLFLINNIYCQETAKFREIDRMVGLINAFPLEIRMTIILDDSLSTDYFKTRYCINTIDTKLVKIIDREGREGKDVRIMTYYYYLDKELIKVEQEITTPSSILIRRSSFYFYKGRPLLQKKKEKKSNYYLYKKRAQALFASYPNS